MAPRARSELRSFRARRTRLAAFEGGRRVDDELAVEDRAQVVVLRLDAASGVRRDLLGLVEHLGEVDAARALGETIPEWDNGVDAAHGLVERAEAELGEELPHLLRHEEEVVDDVLGLAGKPRAQLRIPGSRCRPGTC